jgi:hypothetical protein
MTTSIFGIKTIKEQPKARIELYLCGDIPQGQFSVDDIIEMLNEFKVKEKEVGSIFDIFIPKMPPKANN